MVSIKAHGRRCKKCGETKGSAGGSWDNRTKVFICAACWKANPPAWVKDLEQPITQKAFAEKWKISQPSATERFRKVGAVFVGKVSDDHNAEWLFQIVRPK